MNAATFQRLADIRKDDSAGFDLFFTGFIAGRINASTGVQEAPLALPSTVATVGQVLALYEKTALGVTPPTRRHNAGQLRLIVSRALGVADPESVPLTELTEDMLVRFQEMKIQDAVANADGAIAKREATARAERSSKSSIRQARSCFFGRGVSFLRMFKKEGLEIPPNIEEEFCRCKVRGGSKRVYKTPDNPEETWARIFRDIEVKRVIDPSCYVAFWTIAAFGLRQRELRTADWSHIRDDKDGLAYFGGLGKNGRPIVVSGQPRAVEILKEFRRESGPLCDHRAGRRLNFFLKVRLGGKSDMLAHDLRKYVASLIYEQSPRASQRWLRHGSLDLVEKHYSIYAKAPEIPSVLR